MSSDKQKIENLLRQCLRNAETIASLRAIKNVYKARWRGLQNKCARLQLQIKEME